MTAVFLEAPHPKANLISDHKNLFKITVTVQSGIYPYLIRIWIHLMKIWIGN